MSDPQPLGNPAPILAELGRTLALRHHLIDEKGTVWCWGCNRREALIPSLHCPSCLAAAWGRIPIPLPQCVNRDQTDTDRAACLALKPSKFRVAPVPTPPRAGFTHAAHALPADPAETWDRE